LIRFDRWLSATFDDPGAVFGDPAHAPGHAAAFRRWTSDSRNRRSPGPYDRPHQAAAVSARAINEDLRAVAELFAFVAANRVEATRVVGPSPWQQLSEAHVGSWFRQVSRIPRGPELNARHYVDDHALARISAALPLLGLPCNEQMLITRGDGTEVLAEGFDDPQAMRMILLQILTGRRMSEIRTCEFECLSPAPDRAVEAAGSNEVAQFHYAQSKIDNAPDYILVDREVTAIIAEQQHWVRERFLDAQPRFLFVQRLGNRTGAKGSYSTMLRKFSDVVSIVDGAGRAVRLRQTHRFRHTRLTRLAELGLPIKVLQRYAGHATPTMSMYYVAQREEHAEQAFLATTKLKADGTGVRFSRDDHDWLHLLDRADRFLPNGW
jgi:integrase